MALSLKRCFGKKRLFYKNFYERNVSNIKNLTHCKSVKAPRHWLSSKFDADCVFASIFDIVVYAYSTITVVNYVDV